MLEIEVFISEFLSVDRFTTTSVEMCEITSLDHEIWDDSMKDGSLVVQRLSSLAGSLFSCAWVVLVGMI